MKVLRPFSVFLSSQELVKAKRQSEELYSLLLLQGKAMMMDGEVRASVHVCCTPRGSTITLALLLRGAVNKYM